MKSLKGEYNKDTVFIIDGEEYVVNTRVYNLPVVQVSEDIKLNA